ncbi:MAG: hypothetical protein PHR10_03215 [Sphaerochaetaceae bacterium]|jgi:hypothetical protein|nr:hypothetical protein [Sphaerochaetaceae bacterium]
MKKVLIVLLLCLIVPSVLLADEEAMPKARQYAMGSQMFTFTAGPVLPAFFYRPFLSSGDKLLSFNETHLKVGGYGSIRYQGFLSSTLALGGELGYYFAYDRNDLFTSVPFQAKLTYIPLQGTIEIPLSIGLGFAYNSYQKTSYMSLLATAEVGFSWYFKEEWGLTIGTGLQLIPELYGKDTDNYSDTTLAGFMPITLSVTYRSN